MLCESAFLFWFSFNYFTTIGRNNNFEALDKSPVAFDSNEDVVLFEVDDERLPDSIGIVLYVLSEIESLPLPS